MRVRDPSLPSAANRPAYNVYVTPATIELEKVRGQLSEKEVSDLTFQVMAINAWNRQAVATHTRPEPARA